jgi:hypothetical protein
MKQHDSMRRERDLTLIEFGRVGNEEHVLSAALTDVKASGQQIEMQHKRTLEQQVREHEFIVYRLRGDMRLHQQEMAELQNTLTQGGSQKAALVSQLVGSR